MGICVSVGICVSAHVHVYVCLWGMCVHGVECECVQGCMHVCVCVGNVGVCMWGMWVCAHEQWVHVHHKLSGELWGRGR